MTNKTTFIVTAAAMLVLGAGSLVPISSVSASTGTEAANDVSTTTNAEFSRIASVVSTYKIVENELNGKKSGSVAEVYTDITYQTSFTHTSTTTIKIEEYSLDALSGELKTAAEKTGTSDIYRITTYRNNYTIN